MNKKLVIIQPYIPTYREAFFAQLKDRLAEIHIDCVIAAGMPDGKQAMRQDAIRPDWLVPVNQRTVTIHGRSINLSIDSSSWKEADAVILGLEGSSLPVYQALLNGHRKSVRVGLWGHIKPYVSDGNRLDLWLEKQQMRAASHIFAYTPGGRNYAVSIGIDPSKITTVMNSLDTVSLERAKDEMTNQLTAAFASEVGVNVNNTVCFIGGLDESKRISFLVEALDVLWNDNPDIRLLVGGDGPLKYLLTPAIQRGQVIDLGYLNIRQKALVLSASRCLVMPGRVGLVAVDALVMRRPIVTTEWPYHAPEIEYLVEGDSLFISADHPRAFARTVQDTLQSVDKSEFRREKSEYPRLDGMVNNFTHGVETMFQS